MRKYVSSVIAFNNAAWSALDPTGVVLLGLVMVGLRLCTIPTSCIFTAKADVQSKRISLVLCTLVNLR